MIQYFRWLSLGLVVSGCAVLHHVQVGELDNRGKLEPFDIKVSETGISLDEAASVAKMVSTSQKGDETIETIRNIIGLFQMGPRTGNPVYDDSYARNLLTQILERCPTGKVTGITAIREMRKYPVISGEIVRITGYCIKS